MDTINTFKVIKSSGTASQVATLTEQAINDARATGSTGATRSEVQITERGRKVIASVTVSRI